MFHLIQEQALLNVLPFACVFFEIGIPTKFPSQSGNKLVRPIKEEGQLAMVLWLVGKPFKPIS